MFYSLCYILIYTIQVDEGAYIITIARDRIDPFRVLFDVSSQLSRGYTYTDEPTDCRELQWGVVNVNDEPARRAKSEVSKWISDEETSGRHEDSGGGIVWLMDFLDWFLFVVVIVGCKLIDPVHEFLFLYFPFINSPIFLPIIQINNKTCCFSLSQQQFVALYMTNNNLLLLWKFYFLVLYILKHTFGSEQSVECIGFIIMCFFFLSFQPEILCFC